MLLTDLDRALVQLLFVLALAAALGLVAALLLFWVALRKLKGIDLHSDAGLLTTLRQVPLPLVVALDLLDFSLDVFAAPINWILLRRLKLEPLREMAVIEALLPGTQLLPLMTLGWFAARMLPEAETLGDLARSAGLRRGPRRLEAPSNEGEIEDDG
jgi:hypothetical protein